MAQPDWQSTEDLVLARERMLTRVIHWRERLNDGEMTELLRDLHPEEVVASLDGLSIPARVLGSMMRELSGAYVGAQLGEEIKVREAVDRIWNIWYHEAP